MWRDLLDQEALYSARIITNWDGLRLSVWISGEYRLGVLPATPASATRLEVYIRTSHPPRPRRMLLGWFWERSTSCVSYSDDRTQLTSAACNHRLNNWSPSANPASSGIHHIVPSVQPAPNLGSASLRCTHSEAASHQASASAKPFTCRSGYY